MSILGRYIAQCLVPPKEISPPLPRPAPPDLPTPPQIPRPRLQPPHGAESNAANISRVSQIS